MDWTEHINTLRTSVQATVEDNAGAIIALFGFFVAISVVITLIKRVTKG